MSFDFGVVFCSQESNLDEKELVKLVEESKPVNTKKCTNWGMNKFFIWLNKRNILVDLKTVTEEKLSEVLRKFYAEVKTEKKGMLTPSALTGIRAALHRGILAAPYEREFNLITDKSFIQANVMFNARCKLYYKANKVKPQHKAAIEKCDMNLLNQYFSDLLTNPVKLQEYVWFTLCFHFGRRGRE